MRLPRILACVLALLAAGAQSGEPSVRMPMPKQLAVAKLPPFSAKDRNAEELFQRRHLEKMVEQDPRIMRVVLVYFATWCAPCASGAAKLRAAKETLKKNGVLTVFVNVGETDVASVHKWLKSYGDLGFPLVMDTKSQMVGPYGLAEPDGRVLMPKTLVLNESLKPLFLLGTEGDDFPEILWRIDWGAPKAGKK